MPVAVFVCVCLRPQETALLTTALLVDHSRVILSMAVRVAAAAVAVLAAASADDSFLFLDNGVVRIGVDATRGGSIGWLSASGSSRNLVNHADMGREVQLSFYAGPNPYNPNDLCNTTWGPWPWNPIGEYELHRSALNCRRKAPTTLGAEARSPRDAGAGDVAGNAGAILDVANSSTSISVRSRPLQW